MLRRGLLLAAVLLAGLLLLLWMARAGRDLPAATVAGAPLEAPQKIQAGKSLMEKISRADATDHLTITPDLADPPAEAAPTGALRGLVLNHEGLREADAAIALTQDSADGAGRTARWARSNDDGYFEIDSIPAGNWSVRLARRGPRETQADCCFGEVLIHAGQATWLDVSLAGTRTFTGQFLVPGEDGLGLALVLRALDPPQRLVGETTAVMSAELEQQELSEEAISAHPRSGEFWFWGLAPAQYELFVYLDLPRQHWVRREVDLRQADGDLGTEVLRWEDFFAASGTNSPARPDDLHR